MTSAPPPSELNVGDKVLYYPYRDSGSFEGSTTVVVATITQIIGDKNVNIKWKLYEEDVKLIITKDVPMSQLEVIKVGDKVLYYPDRNSGSFEGSTTAVDATITQILDDNYVDIGVNVPISHLEVIRDIDGGKKSRKHIKSKKSLKHKKFSKKSKSKRIRKS